MSERDLVQYKVIQKEVKKNKKTGHFFFPGQVNPLVHIKLLHKDGIYVDYPQIVRKQVVTKISFGCAKRTKH